MFGVAGLFLGGSSSSPPSRGRSREEQTDNTNNRSKRAEYRSRSRSRRRAAARQEKREAKTAAVSAAAEESPPAVLADQLASLTIDDSKKSARARARSRSRSRRRAAARQAKREAKAAAESPGLAAASPSSSTGSPAAPAVLFPCTNDDDVTPKQSNKTVSRKQESGLALNQEAKHFLSPAKQPQQRGRTSDTRKPIVPTIAPSSPKKEQQGFYLDKEHEFFHSPDEKAKSGGAFANQRSPAVNGVANGHHATNGNHIKEETNENHTKDQAVTEVQGGELSLAQPVPTPRPLHRRASVLPRTCAFVVRNLWWLALCLASIVLLDAPLLLSLGLWEATWLVERTAINYWFPQSTLHLWQWNNQAKEYTYYLRQCNTSDITASHISELEYDYDTMKSQDALKLFQKHGVVVFPDIISPETASELREFILSENRYNPDTVGVFNSTNRWSFAIQIDSHPSVLKASKEILSNKPLVAALERIIGPNPAVTEFTSITAAPGASEQPWHSDASDGADPRYSRSFFPVFSLFTPLQNTTKQMGATEICPGTHLCPTEQATSQACQLKGISTAGTNEENLWKVGTAALVSQQTYHRGTAYERGEDDTGFLMNDQPHRVMFYFTFAPRPDRRLESRSFPQGGTYGIPWHQWGLTLRDYAHPEKYMLYMHEPTLSTAQRSREEQQSLRPYLTLGWLLRWMRTWGIYKYYGDAQWGWDRLTYVLSNFRNHDVEDFNRDLFLETMQRRRRRNGLAFLPKVLHAASNRTSWEAEYTNKYQFDEELWTTYYVATFRLIQRAIQSASTAAWLLYLTAAMVVSGGRGRRAARSLLGFAMKLLFIHLLIIVLSRHVIYDRGLRQSAWGRGISSARLHEYPLESLPNHLLTPSADEFKSTIPNELDILVMDYDMRSDQFGFQNGIFDSFHPGNRAFGELSDQYNAINLLSGVQQHLCQRLLHWSRQQGRRLLVKNADFQWSVVPLNHALHALRFCHKHLAVRSSSVKQAVELLDERLGETRFGYWRETQLYQQHIPQMLVKLQNQIMNYHEPSEFHKPALPYLRPLVIVGVGGPRTGTLSMFTRARLDRIKSKQPLWILTNSAGAASAVAQQDPPVLSQEKVVGPPDPRAWLQVGDLVDVTMNMEPLTHWRHGRIVAINSLARTFDVLVDTGTISPDNCEYCVRPIQRYQEGERVEVWHQGMYSFGWITGVSKNESSHYAFDDELLDVEIDGDIDNEREGQHDGSLSEYDDFEYEEEDGEPAHWFELSSIPTAWVRRVEEGHDLASGRRDRIQPGMYVLALFPQDDEPRRKGKRRKGDGEWFKAQVVAVHLKRMACSVLFLDEPHIGVRELVHFYNLRGYTW